MSELSNCLGLVHRNYMFYYHRRVLIDIFKTYRRTTLNIEIVTTPNDELKETGYGPHQACEDVMQSLLTSNHNAVVTICENVSDLDSVIKRKPDLVVAAVKYIPLKNGKQLWLSESFESHGIFYTGSQKNILFYDSNKIAGKKQVASRGVNTADFFLAIPGEHEDKHRLPLPFPLFIKPTDTANGNGIDIDSLVHDFCHFKKKVKSLYDEYVESVLAEEYLDGKGLTRSFSFITGSSATADMGPLVRGVHGPGQLHIIILEEK